MLPLILVVCAMFFLFGLVQWARGGAILWEIAHSSKPKKRASDDLSLEPQVDEAQRMRSVKDLESMTDRLLKSSFRIIGVLALCVWVFVVVTVVLDMLGLDWLDNLDFRANRFWGNPPERSVATGPARLNRNNILRSLGSGVRR